MTERRSPTRRKDRQSEPHVRIPDSFYERVLPYLTSHEAKLWLALKTREWRKDGRGYVRKPSLRRISKDIHMPLGTAHRAFRGLCSKGLAEHMSNGAIRVLEPDFTTPFTTPFTTEVQETGQRKLFESVPGWNAPRSRVERKRSRVERLQGLSGFEKNALTHGRTVTGSGARRAQKRRARSVDTESQSEQLTDEDRARLTPRGSDARPLENKESKTMNDEDELVKDMPREKAVNVLKNIKAKILRNANEGIESIDQQKTEKQVREDERREFLRQQATELQAEEGEPCD